MFFEDSFEAVACAKSADFDIALAPAGERGDLLDAALFELAEGKNKLFVRGEVAHRPGEQLARAPGGNGLVDAGIVQVEVDRLERHLGADPAFLAQKIVADRDGDSRKPMFEWRVPPELGELFKNPEKNFLGEIIELVRVASKPRSGAKDAVFIPADEDGERVMIVIPGSRDEVFIRRLHSIGAGIAGIHRKVAWEDETGGHPLKKGDFISCKTCSGGCWLP